MYVCMCVCVVFVIISDILRVIMTALLTRIIPCQITLWVKPHPFVLLKICKGVYGFIGAERDDTNIFSFRFEVQGK